MSGRDERHAHSKWQSHDPLQKASSETHGLNQSWLRHGESLTTLQRIGFTIFSLFFVLAGLNVAQWSAEEFKGESFFFGVGYAVATLFFLYFGALGLWNVLRFPRTSTASTDEE